MDETVTAVGIFNSTIGALYRPVVLEKSHTDQYHLTFYDILLNHFQFSFKKIKSIIFYFSTAIFFDFLISYYDTISCLMAACVMVLYHEVQ